MTSQTSKPLTIYRCDECGCVNKHPFQHYQIGSSRRCGGLWKILKVVPAADHAATLGTQEHMAHGICDTVRDLDALLEHRTMFGPWTRDDLRRLRNRLNGLLKDTDHRDHRKESA